MTTFGEQLSAARKAKGLTQEDLAVRVNASRQAISHWENGRAQPDLESVALLSRVLDCSFYFDDASAPAAETPAAEVPAADASAPQPASAAASGRRPRGKLLALAGAVLCLLALGLLLSRLLPKPAAKITVTPLSPIAYLEKNDEFVEVGEGWMVTFSFENVSDVPFTPSHAVVRFYENDRIDDKITLAYTELRRWMDNDQLLRQGSPLHLLFGSDHLYLTAIECEIYGTDANGHDLQFKGAVTLSQEYAP